MRDPGRPGRPGRRGLVAVGIAYLGFVSLGLPDGLLGVAWPSIRETFVLPIDALGLLLLVATCGYLLSSFGNGPAVAVLGLGPLLAASSAVTGIGLAAFVFAPWWWLVLAGGFLVGLGGGAVDAGLNAHAALRFSPRLVNWLHASYGLGAMAGPLIMVAVLEAGRSWQLGYGVVAVMQVVLMVCFTLTRTAWRPAEAAPASGASAKRPPARAALRLPAVWLGVAVFLIYTGLEVAAGQWAYSLLSESRGVEDQLAGTWVSAYWGSLLGGRLVMGHVAERVGAVRLLRWTMLSAVVGTVLVSLRAPAMAAPAGLVLLGWSLAPVFPLLIATTTARVGTDQTANAVGFQMGAAGIGAAGLPGLAGLVVGRFGLESVGPFLVTAAVVMLAVYDRLARLPGPEPGPEPGEGPVTDASGGPPGELPGPARPAGGR